MVSHRNPSRSRVRDSQSTEPSGHQSPTSGNARGPSSKAPGPTAGDKTLTNAQMSSLRKQAEAATLRSQINQAEHADELRRLDKAKAEAELEAMNRGIITTGSNATPGVWDDTEQGELYSPQVLSVTTLFPSVRAKEIHLILHGKFDAYSLHKLRPAVGSSSRDDEPLRRLISIDHSLNRLVFAKSQASVRDFGDNPTTWMQGFIVYTRIVGALFPDLPQVIMATLLQPRPAADGDIRMVLSTETSP